MKEQLTKFQEQCKDFSSAFYEPWRQVVIVALKISEKRLDLTYRKLSGDTVENGEYENLQNLQSVFSEAKINLFSQCQKAGIKLPDFSYKEISELFPVYPSS